MLQTFILVLDWFGLCVFAVSGALVASRKKMDIVGFAMLGGVTGIGGGTIRDVLLGIEPVFWVKQPAYLVTCVVVAVATFFVAHVPQSRERLLLWFDAVGLSLFCVTGADIALKSGAGQTIAIALGVADILGGESPIIFKQEICISAALLGALVFVTLSAWGLAYDASAVAGFCSAFLLRAAALTWNLSLPRYRPRP